MWALLGNLLGGITGAVGKILPDRNRQNDAQSRINEAEVGGAPASMLRLWRSFLGWMLSLLFCWEVAGRSSLFPCFFRGWSDHPAALGPEPDHDPAAGHAGAGILGQSIVAAIWQHTGPIYF